MNVAEKKHKRKTQPSIKVNLDRATIERIVQGPLKATGGRGAASWVRQLIIERLDELESEKFNDCTLKSSDNFGTTT